MPSVNKFKKFIKGRKINKSQIELDTLKDFERNNKETEQTKVEFNIPNDVYNVMKLVEKNFNYYYSRSVIRSKVKKIKMPERIENWINSKNVDGNSKKVDKNSNSMYQSYKLYKELFHFFGEGSLREKKVSKKYEDMGNICSDYKERSFEDPILEDVTKKVNSVIENYKNAFNSILKDNLKELLTETFNKLDAPLEAADKNIDKLKTEVLNDAKKDYYADIRGCTSIIDKCIEKINYLRGKFLAVIKKIDFKFLEKYHSKDLDKINGDIAKINSELDIAYAQLQEYYQAALYTISRQQDIDDDTKNSTNKLAKLLTSKKNYVELREKFLSEIKKENYTSNDLRKNLSTLKEYSSNLSYLNENTKTIKGFTLKFNRLDLFESELQKIKSAIDQSSIEMDKLVNKSDSAKAKVQYAISPMRKVEKVLKVIGNITGAMNNCNSAVGVAKGVLNLLS